MLKLYSESPEGNKYVGLGLTEINVAKLKQDQPIVFDCRKALFNFDGTIVIAYASEKFKAATGQLDFLPKKPGLWVRDGKYVFILDEESITRLTHDSLVVNDCAPYKITFYTFYGKDEQELRKLFAHKIGPQTIVKHEGYSPTDRFNFSNMN